MLNCHSNHNIRQSLPISLRTSVGQETRGQWNLRA